VSPSCFENPSFNNRSADRLFWQMSAFTHSFFEDALWEMSQFPVQNSTAFIIVQITNFTLFSYNFHSCAIYFSLCWKSFGLLTTKLHLFSDPCSLSLLQELRNKPFIRSSVTLCSKLTSRLETEKHWRWFRYTYQSSRKCYIKASSGFFTCQLHLAHRPHNVSSFRIDSFKRFDAAASNCTSSVLRML